MNIYMAALPSSEIICVLPSDIIPESRPSFAAPQSYTGIEILRHPGILLGHRHSLADA
jgi:hypothetical protein